MDADGIRELFEPVGRVTLKRMFGGHGVYIDGLIFALEFDGLLWMKTDDANRAEFEARGSQPFVYDKAVGQTTVMSYWALPDAALDDADELRLLTASALGAARRGAAKKSARSRKRPPNGRP